MDMYVLTRHGCIASRIVQLTLILSALIALLYAVGAPFYEGG